MVYYNTGLQYLTSAMSVKLLLVWVILKVVGVYCDTHWIKPGLYILRGG